MDNNITDDNIANPRMQFGSLGGAIAPSAGSGLVITTGSSDNVWQEATFQAGGKTPSGNSWGFRKERKGISIKKTFKLIKGKTTELEQKRMNVRIAKLERMADELEKNGQFSFSKRAIAAWAALVRESEIYACGFTIFIDELLFLRIVV